MKNLFNIIGFQGCWWACVLGVKYNFPYLGPILMSFFLIIHFLYYTFNDKEYIFIALSALLGTIVDSLFLNTQLIQYNGLTFNFLAPFWIIAMWAGFGATVNHSLVWLDNKYFLGFLLGAVSGPLSYIAGLKFEAINFNSTYLSIGILSISWGVIVPSIFYINKLILNRK